jgi:hypothetical protein
MDEIIEKIIQIDSDAKKITEEIRDKKTNIDKLIEEELTVKEAVLELEYREEIEKKKKEYEKLLENKSQVINQKVNWRIASLREAFKAEKDDIEERIFKEITSIS